MGSHDEFPPARSVDLDETCEVCGIAISGSVAAYSLARDRFRHVDCYWTAPAPEKHGQEKQ